MFSSSFVFHTIVLANVLLDNTTASGSDICQPKALSSYYKPSDNFLKAAKICRTVWIFPFFFFYVYDILVIFLRSSIKFRVVIHFSKVILGRFLSFLLMAIFYVPIFVFFCFYFSYVYSFFFNRFKRQPFI